MGLPPGVEAVEFGGRCGRYTVQWRKTRWGWDAVKLAPNGQSVKAVTYGLQEAPTDAEKQAAIKELCGARARYKPESYSVRRPPRKRKKTRHKKKKSTRRSPKRGKRKSPRKSASRRRPSKKGRRSKARSKPRPRKRAASKKRSKRGRRR